MENKTPTPLTAEEILTKHRHDAAMKGDYAMDYWKINAMKEYCHQQDSLKDQSQHSSQELLELKREVEDLKERLKQKQ